RRRNRPRFLIIATAAIYIQPKQLPGYTEPTMALLIRRMWNEEDGVLSFEWTLLVTLLTIGIVGGLAAARDAIIDELGDTAQVMQAVDQSYHIGFPLLVQVHAPTTSSASDS